MGKYILPSLLVVAMQGAAAMPAEAAKCAERSLLVQKLADRFGETLQGSQQQNQGVLELFASRRAESWTLTLSLDNGLSCLVATGEGFDSMRRHSRGHSIALNG